MNSKFTLVELVIQYYYIHTNCKPQTDRIQWIIDYLEIDNINLLMLEGGDITKKNAYFYRYMINTFHSTAGQFISIDNLIRLYYDEITDLVEWSLENRELSQSDIQFLNKCGCQNLVILECKT